MDVVHALVITDLLSLICLLLDALLQVSRLSALYDPCSSDMDAIMRSFCQKLARWSCRYLTAFMMVVAGCHYVEFC